MENAAGSVGNQRQVLCEGRRRPADDLLCASGTRGAGGVHFRGVVCSAAQPHSLFYRRRIYRVHTYSVLSYAFLLLSACSVMYGGGGGRARQRAPVPLPP